MYVIANAAKFMINARSRIPDSGSADSQTTSTHARFYRTEARDIAYVRMRRYDESVYPGVASNKEVDTGAPFYQIRSSL